MRGDQDLSEEDANMFSAYSLRQVSCALFTVSPRRNEVWSGSCFRVGIADEAWDIISDGTDGLIRLFL